MLNIMKGDDFFFQKEVLHKQHINNFVNIAE